MAHRTGSCSAPHRYAGRRADEVLRIVPVAAFHDGSRFLVDRYATAIAPGLKLVEPKPLTSGAGTALVLGISQSVQGYVDLPNVPHEVAAVHAIQGGDVLLNDAFTRSRFAGDLKNARYNVVHIASHGQFGSDPSRSFVLAFDGPLTMDDLEADIKYGPSRENPLELLVLSACETASGDDRAAWVSPASRSRQGHEARSQLYGISTTWLLANWSPISIRHSSRAGCRRRRPCARHNLRSPPTHALPTPPIGRPSC